MPATDTAGWLTAVGTLFAAVGTVGAVLVALWQTVWRERSDLKTHTYYRPDDDAPGGGILFLTADNPRQAPVNVPAAGLSTQSKVNFLQPGTARYRRSSGTRTPLVLIGMPPNYASLNKPRAQSTSAHL